MIAQPPFVESIRNDFVSGVVFPDGLGGVLGFGAVAVFG